MDAEPRRHPWDENLLFGKAKLYAERMSELDPEGWEYALFSSFVLEFVLRGALAHISPALLADNKDWRNILYAVRMEHTSRTTGPKSIPTSEVIRRLSELRKDFTKEMSDFCFEHVNNRNGELHTGWSPFIEISDTTWLPQFYRVCGMLLGSIDSDLDDLLPDATAARRMIEGLHAEAAKAVRDKINAHKVVWQDKSDEEKDADQKRADQWATRNRGHRVPCPSCGTTALLHGNASGAVTRRVDDKVIVARQRMLPTAFRCLACGLRISGFSELFACGLGAEYTVTSEVAPEEHFGLFTPEDMEMAREEGRNEKEEELMNDDFNEY